MTDLEFDILDELYFVETFEDLQKTLHLDKKILSEGLKDLLEKGWIKCFSENREEIFTNLTDFEQKFDKFSYLATKAGLTAHNTK